MKKTLLWSLFVSLTIVAALGFDKNSEEREFRYLALNDSETEEEYYVPTEVEVLSDPTYSESNDILFLGKSYLGFKEAIGFKESRGKYQVVNPYGYMGKYQFSDHTLKMLGFKNTENFLYDSKQQEAAFHAYTAYNKWVLREEIRLYVGKVVGGVKVTESGILAAAHLSGPGNVKKFLRSSGTSNSSDANGATIRFYMKKFSGYDTSNIVPNKQPQIM